jgi:hypothetical protein
LDQVRRYLRRRVPIEESPNHGVLKLPDELLEYILELVCDPKAKDHIFLSQVCRRFLRVAVGHADLWTYISAHQNRSWRKLQMKHSRDRGLIINTYADYHPSHFRPNSSRNDDHDDCPCADFIVQVLAKHMTWKELRLGPCPILSKHIQGSGQSSLALRLRGLSLPRLKRLDIESSFEWSNIITGDTAIDIIRNNASTWDMPTLKYLTCSIHATSLVKSIYVPLRKIDFLFDRSERDCGGTLMLPAVATVPEISFRAGDIGSTWSTWPGNRIVLASSRSLDQISTTCMVHLPL